MGVPSCLATYEPTCKEVGTIKPARPICIHQQSITNPQRSSCAMLQATSGHPDSPNKASKHNQYILDIQVTVDLPGLMLRGRHSSAHCGNVSVVPCVVVHDHRSVGHGCSLVPIIPPASNLQHDQAQVTAAWHARGFRTARVLNQLAALLRQNVSHIVGVPCLTG